MLSVEGFYLIRNILFSLCILWLIGKPYLVIGQALKPLYFKAVLKAFVLQYAHWLKSTFMGVEAQHSSDTDWNVWSDYTRLHPRPGWPPLSTYSPVETAGHEEEDAPSASENTSHRNNWWLYITEGIRWGEDAAAFGAAAGLWSQFRPSVFVISQKCGWVWLTP